MFHIENGLLRFTGSAVCAAAGLLFMMPFGLGIKNVGNIFGLAVSFIFFVFFAFNGKVSASIDAFGQTAAGRIIVSAVTVFFAAGFLTAFIISCFMVGSIMDKPSEPRPAVLLGCKVNGTEPSLMLTRRLEAAYGYLSENPDTYIVVSGGKGKGEDISEAECMKNYLEKRSIQSERIIMEDRSTDTFENLNYSKKILDDMGAGDEIVIITDSFHQLRASMIASKTGLKTSSVSSQTPLYLLPTYWVREWFGVVEQVVFK